MNCAGIDRLLSEGARAERILSEAGASRHLAECPQCRATFEFLRTPREAPGVRATALPDLRRVRPLPPAPVIAAAFVALAGAVVAGSLSYLGLRGWRLMPAWQSALFTGYAILSGAVLLPVLVSSMRPGARRWAPPLFPPLFIVAGHAALALFYPWNGGTLKAGWQCLTIGIIVGLAATAAAVAVARRGYSLDARASGLLAGGAGALCAALALTLFCPHQSANHFVASHSVAVALVLLMGWWARPAFRRA